MFVALVISAVAVIPKSDGCSASNFVSELHFGQ